MPRDDTDTSSGGFPTTAWTLIRQAQEGRQEDSISALNQLLTAYWKPVFCFLRARGKPLHEAQDLTQEFFLRLLERRWLDRADEARGRFRSFLLTILTRRFLSDLASDRAPRQKTFEAQFVSIDRLLGDAERTYEPPVQETPETVFMKQWAVALVDHVLQQLRHFCEEQGKAHHYAVFAATHFLRDTEGRVSQEELGRRHAMTRDQVRTALERTQQRFRDYLRDEVRGQVDSEEEIGDEIRELLALLGQT
jgi:RNA polymerase sigma-70 factor (ECF subfamily)